MLFLATALFTYSAEAPRKAHKVSVINLDPQTRMEQLVQGFNNKKIFYMEPYMCFYPFSLLQESPAGDEFKGVCFWPGVQCNLEGDIKRINFSKEVFDGMRYKTHLSFGGGTISLACMPLTVESFRLNSQGMRGTVDTKFLPRGLRAIQVMENALFGQFDVSSLPPALINGYFSKNLLNGPIDLTKIPENLQLLDLSQNSIEQRTVYAGNFSSRIVAVHLTGNSIGSVLGVDGNVLADDRIKFDGTDSENEDEV